MKLKNKIRNIKAGESLKDYRKDQIKRCKKCKKIIQVSGNPPSLKFIEKYWCKCKK